MKHIKTLLLLLASTFALSGCFDGGSSQGGGGEGGGGNVPSKTSFTLGETFRFDDLDLTFSTEYFCTKIKDSYSEYNGSKVIGVPVTVKNQGSDRNHLNPFLYDQYGTKGTRLNLIGAYFDDDIEWAGDLLPGSSYTKPMHFLYDGDGEYKVFFETSKQKITLSFNVTYIEPIPEPEPELDKAFTYEDMELTFSSYYSIVVYQPSLYSNKREVVKMPVTVKNNGTKANHLDYLDMKTFGPSGVQITDMNSYYYDQDAVEFAGDLQPGASYTKSMYFEYIGDGQYQIDFGTFETEKSLKFNIQKS